MAAIPPNNNLEGLISSIKDGIYGAYNKGVKYGRYLALQEHLERKETAKPKWVSVEERLPADDENVLVYAIGNNEDSVVAMTGYTHNMYGYNIEGWRAPWQYFFYEYKITHWMPLPEPPKYDGHD